MKLNQLLVCLLLAWTLQPAMARQGAAPDKGLYLQPHTEASRSALPEQAKANLQAYAAKSRYKGATAYRVGKLAQAIQQNRLKVQLPNGKKLKATTVRLDYRDEGHYNYTGELPQEGNILLMARDGEVMGQMRYRGTVYSIQQLPGGGAVVLEQDGEALKNSTCGTEDTGATTTRTSPAAPAPGSTSKNTTNQSTPAPDTEVRVLVLFTPAARASVPSISNLIDVANAQLNDGLANSGIFGNQISFSVVAKREFRFSEDSSITRDIRELPKLSEARSLRDQYQADIVVLLTNGDYGGIAGVASEIGPIVDSAYAIAQTEYATATYTYAHEVGHLMGLRHQQCSVYNTGRGGCDDRGQEEHGWRWMYRNWFLGKRYYKHTIMHQLVINHDRELKFSTPMVEDNGEKIGQAGTNDNVLALRQNAPVVAAFRQTAQPIYLNAGGPGSADDGETIALSAAVSGGTPPYTYEWQTSTDNVTYTTIPGSGATVYTAMPIGSGLYYRATVTDAQGLTATSPYSYVTNSSNGGGGGDPCVVCPDKLPGSRVADAPAVADKPMLVYPVPTTDAVTIRYATRLGGPVSLRLTNAGGKTVQTESYEQAAGTHTLTTSLDALPAGLYYIILETPQRVQTYRLIKE